jgi:hypothetical protein
VLSLKIFKNLISSFLPNFKFKIYQKFIISQPTDSVIFALKLGEKLALNFPYKKKSRYFDITFLALIKSLYDTIQFVLNY